MAAQPDVIEKKVEKTGHVVVFDYPEGRSAEDYNTTGYHKITGRDYSELICTPMQKNIEVAFTGEGIEVTNLSERAFKEGSVINLTVDRRGSSIGDAKIVGITNTARTMDTPAFLTNVANPDGEGTGGHIIEPIPTHIVTPEAHPGVDPVTKAHPLEHRSIPEEDRQAQLDDAVALEEARADAAAEASRQGSDVAGAVAEAETEAKNEAHDGVLERADRAGEAAADRDSRPQTTQDVDASVNTNPAPTTPAQSSETQKEAKPKATTTKAKADQDKDKNAAEKKHDASKPKA